MALPPAMASGKMCLCVCFVVCLIQANRLPPDRADAKEHGDVEDGETEANLPPGGEGHVAGAEERGRGADAVVRGAAHDVGEDAKDERGDERGRAARHQHGEERRVHGADVRGAGSEGALAED